MGIQAPTSSDNYAAIITALVSYDRPILLFITFLMSFLLILLISGKNVIVSLFGAFAATFALGFYLAYTYLSSLRY